MQQTPAPAHLSLVGSHEVAPAAVTRDDSVDGLEQRAVGFSVVDRLPLEGLIDHDNSKAIIAWAGEIATALVGTDRDGARLRLIARSIASERARLTILEAMLDDQLVAKNFAVVRELNPLISSTTRRLCSLLREHQASCANGARATIVVGHADQVHVDTST